MQFRPDKDTLMSLIPQSARLHDYATIYNFRDFGGYAGLGGRPVVTGRLFRSAHLASLSDTDHGTISDLDVNLVVDLRHAPERRKQPSRLLDPTPTVHEYPDSPDRLNAKVAPHEAFLEHELYSAEDARGYMMRSYTARPHDPGFQAIFRDTLAFMAEHDNDASAGVLVHCAAGKDRTGTLVALIHGLLGVSRDDILADYMLTLDAVDIDAILVPASAAFSERYGRPIDAESLWPMFGVEPAFLEAALDGMGDMERYTRETLGLSADMLSTIRARYLEAE
jgi:protein-tyrosine phosphatase